MQYLILVLIVLLLLITGCSNDSAKTSETSKDITDVKDISPTSNLSIPDNRFANNYQVLLFGNSHVSGLDSLITMLISKGNPYAEVKVINAGGGFLDNKSSQQSRTDTLESQTWTHLILQGQKYSQSGNINYSTKPAQTWIEKAKQKKITPILFPEHPQEGSVEEGQRVHYIHTGIAAIKKACVAPIGLAWDKVIMTEPYIKLHSNDGNHASLTGRLLTAYVFYGVITGESPDLLPYIKEINVDDSAQQLLKQFAAESIQTNLPCKFDS